MRTMLKKSYLATFIAALYLISFSYLFSEQPVEDRGDFTQSYLNRLVMENYRKSLVSYYFGDDVLDANKFELNLPSFRRYRIEGLAFDGLPLSITGFAGIDLAMHGVFDSIPIVDYYELIDRFYLSDVEIIRINHVGNIMFNARDLSRGDYFLWLNFDLHSRDRKRDEQR